jgi:lysophospholipase L1-like esterase
LDDGLHLSEKGHELYFKIMQPVIADTIQEIISLRT